MGAKNSAQQQEAVMLSEFLDLFLVAETSEAAQELANESELLEGFGFSVGSDGDSDWIDQEEESAK